MKNKNKKNLKSKKVYQGKLMEQTNEELLIQAIRKGDVNSFDQLKPNAENLFWFDQLNPNAENLFWLPGSITKCHVKRVLSEEMDKYGLGEEGDSLFLLFPEKVKLYKERAFERENVPRDLKNLFLIADSWLGMRPGAPFEHKAPESKSGIEYSTFGYVLRELKLQAVQPRPNLLLARAKHGLTQLTRAMRDVGSQFPYGMEREVHEYLPCTEKRKRCRACAHCETALWVIDEMRRHNERPSDKQYYQMMFCRESSRHGQRGARQMK